MSLFRSRQMSFSSILIPRDVAWEVLHKFGEMASLHFVDSVPNLPQMNRPFYNYVKRCDEALQQIEYIFAAMEKFSYKVYQCQQPDKFFEKINQSLRSSKREAQRYFDEVETDISKILERLTNQVKNYQGILDQKNQLIEEKSVLHQCSTVLGPEFFKREKQGEGALNITGMNLEDIKFSSSSVNHIVGIIDQSEYIRFQRLVFRVTKGNMVIRQTDMDVALFDKDNQPVEKVVFFILYPSGNFEVVKTKLNRACDSFGAARFEISEGQHIDGKISALGNQILEHEGLLSMTQKTIIEILRDLQVPQKNGGWSYAQELRLFILCQKTLYTTMNMLKDKDKYLEGKFWYPKEFEIKIQKVLGDISAHSPNSAECIFQIANPEQGQSPPTYLKMNEFTNTFQEIVNTYGIPRYQEVNPGIFTIATFPFLFGVMFGDIGHGSVLFMIGLYMVLNNENISRNKDNLFRAALPARYLLLLMGFFATYCGFIYNDFTSISMNLFGSCYDPNKIYEYSVELKNGTMNPTFSDTNNFKTNPDCVYPFGIDPIWAISTNNLLFVNSYKMKMAVIFGVVHMTLGIFMKGVNAVYFNNMIDLFCEFVPQIIFMFCTFIYMDFLIIYKWLNFDNFSLSSTAPSIITIMIDMPLKFGAPGVIDPEHPNDNVALYGFDRQQDVQIFLLVVAVLCIPWILVPKPLLLNKQYKAISHKKYAAGSVDDLSSHSDPLLQKSQVEMSNKGNEDLIDELRKVQSRDSMDKQEAHGHDEHEFGEIFVHQIIETIEFVLGSISNTASYLRLWALSLAHGQLAEVFFDKGLAGDIEGGSYAMIFKYYMFALITFGVLMCMDVMECFLHALRLHWVEFQNKFYQADGYKFSPYSFAEVIALNSQESEE